MCKFHFLVNTNSRGKTKRVLQKAINYLDELKQEYKIHICSTIEETVHSIRIAESEKAVLIVIGGDGTNYHVVNNIEDFDSLTLGFIGGGTGNDFVKGLGIHKNVKRAMDDIIRGETMNLDLIDVCGKKCLNVAGTGLDIEVLKRCERSKILKGKAQYLWSLIITLIKFRCYDVVATVDGEEKRYDALLIAVANCKYFGGGMMVAPHGDPTNGKLNITVVHRLPRLTIAYHLINFLKGKHSKCKYIENFTCDTMRIECPNENPLIVNIDGELFPNHTFDCKVIPGILKAIKPSK